jgi:hypothetical protein
MTVRLNHLGMALQRHRRAGGLELRDKRVPAPDITPSRRWPSPGRFVQNAFQRDCAVQPGGRHMAAFGDPRSLRFFQCRPAKKAGGLQRGTRFLAAPLRFSVTDHPGRDRWRASKGREARPLRQAPYLLCENLLSSHLRTHKAPGPSHQLCSGSSPRSSYPDPPRIASHEAHVFACEVGHKSRELKPAQDRRDRCQRRRCAR